MRAVPPAAPLGLCWRDGQTAPILRSRDWISASIYLWTGIITSPAIWSSRFESCVRRPCFEEQL